ncbi:MAG: hypothetical protein IT580_16515 [Verrucomicrobiales bacterium]|nr:hypothetical protein [Verrucomicrobiales bacterium]
MSAFEIAFPGYVEATVALHRALWPAFLALLTLGVITRFWRGVPTPFELAKSFVLVFLVIGIQVRSHALINAAQQGVRAWMERSIPARPENVAARFKEKLAEAQGARETEDEGFLDQIFSTRHLFEAIVFACLTLIAWLAMAVMAFVYSVQRALLLAAWSISPILTPLITIPPLSGLGLRHLLRIVGLILWPVGLGLAATFSEGLIEVIAAGTSFDGISTGQALGRGLTSLLGIVVLAIWILFSTVMAPVLVHRVLVGTDGTGLALQRGGSWLFESLPSPTAVRGFARGAQAQAAALSQSMREWWGQGRSGSQAGPDVPPSSGLGPWLAPTPATPTTSGTTGDRGASIPGADDPTGDQAVQRVLAAHRPPNTPS